MASMALPRVFVRNILARVADADLWALLRGFSLEHSVMKIHPVRKPPAQTAADSPMLVYFECRDDSSCSALIALLDGQHFPGICKYALKAEMATPRLERQSASKSMANVRTVGPRPCPVPAPPPPPWQGLPIPPPPPPGVQRVIRPAARPVRPARPVPSSIPTMPPAGLGAQPDACQPEADVGDDGGLQLRLSFSLLFLFRSVLVKKEVD